ncbi:MAG: Hsp20/alpha crystallin family protein [Eubacterium sp.]|nr:Hsp20/alpha crystallin family protein [Eubacterium sp.]
MLMPSIFGRTFMDDLFEDFDRGVKTFKPVDVMKTDIKENDDSYEIGIDLPGYTKDDVHAELKDGYLVISAEKENTTDESEDNYIRRERYFGSCSRSYYVGDAMKEEDIKAKFENGVLTLNVPKKTANEVEEKKYIQIAG